MSAITIMVAVALLAGCASRGKLEQAGGTSVALARANYRVLKANAVGEDTAWSLLCFIPLGSPQHAAAKARLYEGSDVQGKATGLANLTEDRQTLFLLLVCRDTLTLSADIIEFTDPPQR